MAPSRIRQSLRRWKTNSLSIRNLDVFYGRLQAVHGLSFEVGENQIVTLLGANGAGKSSVIRAISGLVPVEGTSIQYAGQILNRLRPDQRVTLGVATVLEGREVFHSLSVSENLKMGAYRRRDRTAVRRDLAWIYDLFPPLGGRQQTDAGSLSGGQAQMLAIGRALMASPRLLLLDEPSHGLAPLVADVIFHLIPRLREERGLSILLVEQNANKALTVASYGYVLEAGSLALEGPTSELSSDPRVRALYLGG